MRGVVRATIVTARLVSSGSYQWEHLNYFLGLPAPERHRRNDKCISYLRLGKKFHDQYVRKVCVVTVRNKWCRRKLCDYLFTTQWLLSISALQKDVFQNSLLSSTLFSYVLLIHHSAEANRIQAANNRHLLVKGVEFCIFTPIMSVLRLLVRITETYFLRT